MKKQSSIEKRVNRHGYYFVLPFLVIYILFHLWPTLYTFVLAFSDLKGLRSDFSFVGFENFIKLVQDKFFWEAVGNTFIMWGLNFIPQLGIALLFAIWFTDVRLRLKCKGLFRAIFYMPNLLTAASVAILYRSLFGSPIGPINQFLNGVLDMWQYREGVDGEIIKEAFSFFRSPWTSRSIVAFIQWWLWCGHTLIMLMAGITSISPTLYEAAVIDGASNRQTTWMITLPLLRPMMLYILVTSMIGGMQLFEIPFMLTDGRGAPGNSIRTTSVYLYNTAFQGAFNYAYAAAIAIGMFVITIILAFFINKLMKEKK